MTNPVIKLGLYISPPDVDPCVNRTGSLEKIVADCDPGLVSGFLSDCLRFARLNYEITTVSRRLGTFNNETFEWSDLLGDLERDRIDMITTFATYSEIRNRYFTYTRFFDTVQYVFLIRKENVVRVGEGPLLLVHGFSNWVWIWAVITLTVLMASMTIARWVHRSRDHIDPSDRTDHLHTVLEFSHTIFSTFWDMTIFVFQQSAGRGDFQRSTTSVNCLFAYLALFTVIFVNLYQNVVYSQITAKSHKAPFQSSEELVNLISTNRLTLITLTPDIAYFDGVNHSEYPHFAQMRRALNSNPLKILNSHEEILNCLLSGGYVYVSLEYSAMRMAQKYCNLKIVNIDAPTMFNGFVLKKRRNLELFKKLDHAVFNVQPRLENLKNRLRHVYWRTCPESIDSLSLNTMSGLFFIYVYALGLAFLVLAMETVWKRKIRPYTREMHARISRQASAVISEQSVEKNSDL